MVQVLESINIVPLATYTATIDPLNIVNTSSPIVNSGFTNGVGAPNVAVPLNNNFYQGVTLFINVTVAGAGFMTPKIYGRVDNGDGTSYDVILASWTGKISGTGTYILFMYPAAQNVTSGNTQSQNGALTPNWRPVIVFDSNTNYKLSVTAVYVR